MAAVFTTTANNFTVDNESATGGDHDTIFTGQQDYKLVSKSPEITYIWDVNRQAATSDYFNTTNSTNVDSSALFHDDVLGANEHFYDRDTHEKTPSFATGRLAVDSGATLTIFDAGLKSHLQNIRNSKASIQGFAGTARTLADCHGTAHMFIVHPTDSSLCEHLTLPGDVVNEASQGLVSAYDICRGQGFTLILNDGNSDVEGFYKFTEPLTFCDGRLESGIVSKYVPVVFDPARRLWYLYYAIAASPAAAKQAGLQFQNDLFLRSSNHAAHFSDHGLFEGAAAKQEHFSSYDECFSAFSATLPALFDTTLYDGVYNDELDQSIKYWTHEIADDLHNSFAAEAYDVHATSMDQMYEELTNGELNIELEHEPVSCDCTKFWLDNDAVLSAGTRAAERKETVKSRHEKLAHMGHCPGCTICQQVRGSLRSVMGSATAKGDPVPGRTWSFDSIYWSHSSRQGNIYTICGRDQKTGYCQNIECATRKDAGLRIIECIKDMRADPELNNPNIATFVLLDPAGEWGMEFTEIQKQFKMAGIISCVRPTASDKRLMGHAEHTVKLTETGCSKVMISNALSVEDREFASEYALMLRNLVPMRKNAGPDGDGIRPLTAISGGRVTNRECLKRLFYCQPPGTLALVQIPHYPKGSNVKNLARSRWGRVIRMEKDVVVFEDMKTRTRFRSKNFVVVAIPPGMSAYEYVGLKVPPLPTTCLPLLGNAAGDDSRLVVQLDSIVPKPTKMVRSIVEDISGHGSESNGKAIVTDATGRILERINEDSPWLMPTSSHIVIEQTADAPENLGVSETVEYQIQMLDYKPAHFVGRSVFRRFKGFTGVSRGVIIDTEPEEGSEPLTHLWGIQFEDGYTTDFTADDMKSYCILLDHGTVDKPKEEPPKLDSDSSTDDECGDDEQPERFDHNTVWYHMEDNETFLDMCEKFRLTKTKDQMMYFRWNCQEFNRGNLQSFCTADNCIWFPSPFSAIKSKQSGAQYKFKAGTQFPRPEGEFWGKFVRDEKSQSTQPDISATTIDDLAGDLDHPTYNL